MNAATITARIQAGIAAEQAAPSVTPGQWVTITRPSMIDGRPRTRRVYVEEAWVNGADPEHRTGQPWIVTNEPGHPYRIHEVLTAAERATASATR